MRPVLEKKKIQPRYIVYIIIILVCLCAIGVAVYMQFFKDEKLGVILGITSEKEDEEYKELKGNFLNIFDNSIKIVERYSGNVEKIRDGEDIIIVAYDSQEQNENYTIDMKIPCFNINSIAAKQYNQQIRSLFKQKSENVMSSDSQKNVIYNVKYKAYEKNNILSLIILSELKEGESSERIIIQTYNYNLQTNEKVTIDDMLTLKNINIADANNTIKNEINNAQEQNIKLSELGYNVDIRDAESDVYKIENAKEFFIGENGYLYIVYAYGNDSFTSEIDVVIFR